MPEETLPAVRTPLAASGGAVTAIIPKDIDQMFRLANAMHISGLSPATLKSPEQVMIAIMAGAELGLPPFQAVQSFAVVNGRPCLFGDGLLAVVRANGFRVREWLEGEGDGMIARCECTRPDSGETTPGEFSVSDAKRASLWGKLGPWAQYPKRMLKMRARAFALRDSAADVLRGFQMREEVEDYHDAPPTAPETRQGSGLAARLGNQTEASTSGFNAAHVDKETATDPKPPGRRRKATAPEPVNDAAQSTEATTASQGAAETTHHDPETGEVLDAEFEDVKAEGEQGGAETTKSPASSDASPGSGDFPGDRPATEPGDQPGTEQEDEKRHMETSPNGTGSSSANDAPYTEMAEQIEGAAHWLGIKQVLKTFGKTEHWKTGGFRDAAMTTAWRRFKHLQDEGEEDTEVFSDYGLFQLWLECGAKSAAEIDAVWPTFYRGPYKTSGEPEQKRINELRTRRKEALKA